MSTRSPRHAGTISALVLVVMAGMLSGCAQSTAEPPSSSPTAAPGAWIRKVDTPSGVSFPFPAGARPQARTQQLPDGTTVRSRQYARTVDGVDVGVSVIAGRADLASFDAAAVYRGMVLALQRQGAKDARLSHQAQLRVAGHHAVDATLTFTASTGEHNYWRLRTIRGAGAVVMVQALTFAPAADLPVRSRRVDALFRRLSGGVRLP